MLDDDNEKTFILEKRTIKKEIWGRLVSLQDPFPNVDLTDDEVFFGRKDLPPNVTEKRMSSKHLRVFLENDQPFIEDLSSNGTYLDGAKLNKGVKVLLENKAVITFFSSTHEPDTPHFVFQDKRKNPKDEASKSKSVEDTATTSNDAGKRKREEKEPENQPKPKRMPTIVSVEDQKMEETLTCGICQDIFYKCVSLLPCLHSFCCCCITDWLDRSTECPECRQKIKGISKQHILQNLVDLHLEKYPTKKRSEEDIKELAEKSDIEKLIKNFKENYSGNNNDDDEDNDDDDEDDYGKCKQCPPGDGSGFICNPTRPKHLACSACFQLMPDRHGSDGIIQKCFVCEAPYCHLYWGCTAANAANRFKKLADFTFTQIPDTAFEGNDVENNILVEYLKLKGLTVTDCFKECVKRLDRGESKSEDKPNLTGNDAVCDTCASTLFAQVVFDYLKAVPKRDLPAAYQNLPNCYYGKNCRTQSHNQKHRAAYSHVCDQTKF